MYILVCLEPECAHTEYSNEAPEQVICGVCNGLAVYYTARYWLEYVKQNSGAPYGAPVLSTGIEF